MSWVGWQERTRLSILCGLLGLKRSGLSTIILLSDRDEYDFKTSTHHEKTQLQKQGLEHRISTTDTSTR